MAKTEISGDVVDMFVQGYLGIKAFGYDPSAASGTPLSAVVHIKDAKDAKDRYLGNVLLVKEGQNLKFVVGTNFSDHRLGFGLKVSIPAGELVHELFVPAIPAAAGWVYLPSPLDRDDEGKTFKVRYALAMKDELQIKDFRERTRLTINAWPITSWELNGSVYDSSMRYAATRSLPAKESEAKAGRLAGLVKGDPLPLTTNLKHARVHAADWELRQSIDLQLMATDKDIEVKPRAAAAE